MYLDTSALVKRYVDEAGSLEVRAAMGGARAWAISRVGYVEAVRALAQYGVKVALERFQLEWPSFNVVELDLEVAEDAAELAIAAGLRSLDAIHLAAALSLPRGDLTFATWDARLHEAARERDLRLLPESLAA